MGSSATVRGSSSRCRVKVVRIDVARLATGCLLVVLGACGDESAPPDAVTPDLTTTTTTTSSTVGVVESTSSAPTVAGPPPTSVPPLPEPSAPPIGDDVAIVADPAPCIALANMYAAEEALSDAGFSVSARDMASQYEYYRAILLEVRDSASEEIGADIDLMVDAADLSFAALEAADFDVSEAEAPFGAEMSESLEDAGQRIREYAETECGPRFETCRGERATLEVATEAYYSRHGAYPAGVEDLVGDLIREPPRYHEVHGDGVIVARPGAGCE